MNSFKTTKVVDDMAKGLREVDDSFGRCYYCNKLMFKGETFVIPNHLVRSAEHGIAHANCEQEYIHRSSQI